MADSGIKKTTVKYTDLPALSVATQGYTLRYRIISEDRNRTSHWSPVTNIVPNYIYNGGEIDFFKQGNIVTSTWDSVTVESDSSVIETATEYDVWIRYGRDTDGDWIYRQRVTGNSISTVHPSTYTINGVVQASPPNRYSIEVYMKGIPVTRDATFLRVYQDGPHTI